MELTRERVWSGVLVGVVCLYAIITRLLAFFQPYHQDEYKWALAAGVRAAVGGSDIPHPFFGRFVYEIAGYVVGYEHLRIVPILLSLAILVLLYVYMRSRFGLVEAMIACGIYVFSFYALLGSVQIDIDGAFLPLFALIAFIGYERLSGGVGDLRISLGMLIGGLLLGFVTKLSFVLVPLALIAHFLWQHQRHIRPLARKEFLLLYGALATLAVLLVWYFSDAVFVRYIKNFIALGGRDYFQILFLSVKACIYLSPVMLLGMLLGLRQWRQLALWYLFLALNIAFYFVVFDFSHRTFDRYLMFAILPGAVIAGVAFGTIARAHVLSRAHALFCVALLGLATIAFHTIFGMPHRVLPLIPKSAFLDALMQFRWDFLLPLTGGSGPLGFYVPWDGIASLWLICVIAYVCVVWGPKKWIAFAAFMLLLLSCIGNVFVTAEYLRGHYYGSSPVVLRELVEQIDAMELSQPVLTYNDTGAYELFSRDLYGARFYPHPQFIPNNIEKFKNHRGYYLIVDIPAIAPDSGYARYFAECTHLADARSGAIRGSVLDCAAISPEGIKDE